MNLLVTLQSDSILVAVNSAAAEEIDTAPFEIPINELWLLNIITITVIIIIMILHDHIKKYHLYDHHNYYHT
jgi:hypothetical protein